MNKKLDVSSIENELATGSVFFRKPQPDQGQGKSEDSSPLPQSPARPRGQTNVRPSQSVQSKKRKTVRNSARKSERADSRTKKLSVSFPLKRSTKRYSFEFYTDQLATLKWMEGQAMLAGGSFNKSDLIRKALDAYFKKIGVNLVTPKE